MKKLLSFIVCVGMMLGLSPVYAAGDPVAVTGSTSYSTGMYIVNLDVVPAEGYTVSSVTFNEVKKLEEPYSFTVNTSGDYDYEIVYAGKESGTQDGTFHVAEAITLFTALAKAEYTVAVGTAQNDIGLPTSLAGNNTTSAAIDPAPAVSWNCETYNAEMAGDYTFTAALSEATYILADGVVMPSVIVTVTDNANLSDNAKAYIAAVKALNKDTIIAAVSAWAADPENEELSNASDAAMAPVIAADDLYNTLSEDNKSEEAVVAAYVTERDIYNAAIAAMSNQPQQLNIVQYGDFSVTTTDTAPTYSNSTLTFGSAGTYTISNTKGVGTATTDYINVNATADITIILAGVTINNSGNDNPAFKISNTGTTTVTLKDGTTNTLTAGGYHAGLENGTSPLVINGTGTLNATGHGDDNSGGGAGIGGGTLGTGDGSNITIENGIVVAQGATYAAGIGGGCTRFDGSTGVGSNIKISGGNVTATGGRYGAGIGGGDGSGSNITISGGTVKATGGGVWCWYWR